MGASGASAPEVFVINDLVTGKYPVLSIKKLLSLDSSFIYYFRILRVPFRWVNEPLGSAILVYIIFLL